MWATERASPARYNIVRRTFFAMRQREMERTDVDEVLRLRTLTRENALSMEELAERGITPESTARLLDEDVKGWVSEEAGKILGFAMGDGRSGEVLVLAVLPEHEGRGIGRRLLGAVRDWLFSRGHRELWLLANPDPAVRASGFDRRLGWLPTGELRGEEQVLKQRRAPPRRGARGALAEGPRARAVNGEMAGRRSEIVLIGPIGAGKSTLAELLAEALGLQLCSMDDHRWRYYEELGYDRDEARAIRAEEGFPGIYRYWKPFEIHAVERLLADHTGCVIEFGAGHSVYEDDELFERARRALEPYDNVVLVLPSPDPDESIAELRRRNEERLGEEIELNAHFVTHPSNYDLAKHVVYTAGKGPEETRDEILARVRGDRT